MRVKITEIQTTLTTKSTRGGARIGSGPKAVDPTAKARRRSITVSDAYYTRAKIKGDGNASRGFCLALDEVDEKPAEAGLVGCGN